MEKLGERREEGRGKTKRTDESHVVVSFVRLLGFRQHALAGIIGANKGNCLHGLSQSCRRGARGQCGDNRIRFLRGMYPFRLPECLHVLELVALVDLTR